MAEGKNVQLEAGLKRAVEWIGQMRLTDPGTNLAGLIDEACRKYDLSPIQADFLFRHFAQ
jgi:hypothetical protein